MAQNDNTNAIGTNNILHWILALAILALICLKGYDYYQVIELRQKQIALTEEAKAIQDSVRAFIERGKMACRVCKDYEANNPEKINEGVIIIGVLLLVGGAFAWAFKDFS